MADEDLLAPTQVAAVETPRLKPPSKSKHPDEQYPTPPQDAPPPPDEPAPNFFQQFDDKPKVNFFQQFDTEPDAGMPGLTERFRLNKVKSYYRDTVAGAYELMQLRERYDQPDLPTPEIQRGVLDTARWQKAIERQGREQYDKVISDLARYDAMQPWSGTLEGAMALTGSLVGGASSPESFLGWGAKGATMLARTIKVGVQQGTIQAVTDIPIQAMNIKAGIQHDFEPERTVAAGTIGFVIGGGAHFFTGELLPQWLVKNTLRQHGTVDPSVRRPDEPAPRPAPEPEAAPAPEPAPPRAGIEPTPAPDIPPPHGLPGGIASAELPAPPPVIPEQATPNVHRVTTPAGQSVEVQPVVMEARDLITSSDAGYDPTLQPRDRSRIASQQQIREIAANLDPERLGFSTEAGFGAPIIGPDKMVESGNARVMAIRQAYLDHPEAAQRYRDWIAAQGLDVSGFEQPVVVRQRTTVMTPEERQIFTVGANQPATLTYSASERALTDARLITTDSLDLLRVPGDLGAPGNRDFIRSFIGRLPVTEQGAMIGPEGTLTSEGLTRVRNAVVASAFGDAPVLTRIAESTDDEIKSISNSLVAVAPEWAKLRADVNAGLVRADVEQTGALVEAVTRTADLRSRGQKLAAFLAQQDAFDQIDPIVADFMRMFYDAKGQRAAGTQRITNALQAYATEARKVSAGGGLDLGLPPVTAEELQRVARERASGQVARTVTQEGLPYGGGARDGTGAETGGGAGVGPGPVAAGQPAGAAGIAGGEARPSGAARPAGPGAAAGAPERVAAEEQTYVDQAMRSLEASSRTAKGIIDVEGKPGKAEKIVGGLTPAETAALAKSNFEATVRDLYQQRDNLPTDTAGMERLLDATAERVNRGIVKEGELSRTADSAKQPYTNVADLAVARRQFAEELLARLRDPNADPIETAAWIEWRVNLTDHFHADGAGKTSRALAALPLMRAGLDIPAPERAAYFAAAARTRVDPKGGGQAYLGAEWDKFNAFYHSLFERPSAAPEIMAARAPNRVEQIASMIRAGKTPTEVMKELNIVSAGYGDDAKNLTVELSRNGVTTDRIMDILEGKAPEPETFAMRTTQRMRQQGPTMFDQREAEGQLRMAETPGPTLKEKLEAEAQAPLRGGAAGPKEGGLFDTGAREAAGQGDLFAPTKVAGPATSLFMRPPRARVPGTAGEPVVPSARPPTEVPEAGDAALNAQLATTRGVRNIPDLNPTPEEITAVQDAIASKARPNEIEALPLIKRAYEIGKSLDPTNLGPGYGTAEYRANRKFVFDRTPENPAGTEVIGYTKAIDRQVEGAESFSTDGPVRNEAKAYIIIGPGGAGKSTIVANPLARRTFSAVIDADEAKPIMAEYKGGIGASAVHEESADITYGNFGKAPIDQQEDSVLWRLAERGANLVIGKIGHATKSIQDLQKGLSDLGYQVNLVNLVVDPEEAFRRRIERFLRTGRVNASGYKADEQTVGGTAGKISKNYYILKGEGKYHDTLEINVDQRPAKIIDDGRGGLQDLIGLRAGREGYQPDGGDLATAQREAGARGPPAAPAGPAEGLARQLDEQFPPGIRERMRVQQAPAGLRETSEDALIRQRDWVEYYARKHGLPIESAVREAGPAPTEFNALAERRGGERLPGEAERPDTGIPEPPLSPQERVAIQSLQQQTAALAEALDFPLRQGRQARGTLGQFSTGTGVVRTKEIADFEVVAHEAGHAIETKIGAPLASLIQNFDHELAPLVSSPADYPRSRWAQEGFAEYMRQMMGSPARMLNEAPGFTIAFRQLLERSHPDILRALSDAGQAYRDFIAAPSVDAIGAVRRSKAEIPHTLWQRVVKQVQDEGFFPSIKLMLEHGYTAFTDVTAPMGRGVREMALLKSEMLGGALVDLKSADNPEVLLKLFARAEQAGLLDLVDGVRPHHDVRPVGPSLASAITKAIGAPSFFGRWDQEGLSKFGDYLIARRGEYLWRKYLDGQLQNPPVAFKPGDAMQAMADLERANPGFREASDMVHGYTRELLRKMYDGNLITRDLHDKLQGEEFYVPFMRDLSDRPLKGGGFGSVDATRASDAVKRIRGSTRDIIDPLESLMTQTYMINRAIRHNDIILALKRMATDIGPKGGRYFEDVKPTEAKEYKFEMRETIERLARERGVPAEDIDLLSAALSDVFGKDPMVGSFWRQESAGARGEPLVFYKEAGEQKVARVMSGGEGHAIYELLTALPTGLSDTGLQMMAVASATMRAGVVTNPVYVLTNYFRDQLAVGILRPDYIPFVSSVKGLVSELSQGEAARLYGYFGGVSAGSAIAPLKQAAESNLDALAKRGYVVNRVSSLHGMLEAVAITEAGTRNSVFGTVYQAGRRMGLSDYEAAIEAAFQATDASLNFGQRGSKTLAVVALTPFVNSWMVGMDKAWRTFVTPLARRAMSAEATVQQQAEFRNAWIAWTKMAGIGGALGAAWAALHADDEIYADAPAELKGTHFVTSVGNKVVVMPKPFELSIGFTAGEFAYQAMMKQDPRAGGEFAEAAWEVLKPQWPIVSNPLIKTGYELWGNKSTFTGRPLVPDRLLRLTTAEQVTDRTTPAAKYISKLTGYIPFAGEGMSPIKVDHAIGGLFGTWGRDMAAMSRSIDPESPATQWEDGVFLRRFIKDPRRMSDITHKFWDYMGQTTGKYNQAVNTYDSLIKSFRDADANDFLQRLPGNERTYVTLQSASDERGKQAFSPDVKRLHPLRRAYDATLLLIGLQEEMAKNTFRLTETGENVKLDDTTRRDVLDNVRELAQKEMRNALVIMKEPGYTGRALFETQVTLDKIRALSPQVADEIAQRYQTKSIYTTKAVASAWPQFRDEVLRNGSRADVSGLAYDAKGEGTEFEGETGGAPRVKRPVKRRVPIPPQLGAPQ